MVEDAPAQIERQTELPGTPVKVVTAPAVVVAPSDAYTSADTAANTDAHTTAYTGSAASASSSSPAVTLQRRDLEKFHADPDSGIVENVPQHTGEVAEGTLLHARLRTAISTASTAAGARFSAELTEPLMNIGRVVAPAGSLVEGRVTELRSGKRIRGTALIHLETEALVLPDGSRIPLRASVIDTDQTAENRTDNEGNVLRKDHAKQTLAAASLATGGAAAAGGVIAGVPGALVGAGIGAGVSTVVWLKEDRQAQLPEDSMLVLALSSPLTIQSLVREPNYSANASDMQPEPRRLRPSEVVRPAEPAAQQSFVPSN